MEKKQISESYIKDVFAANLRHRIRDRSMTQSQFAIAIGTSPTHVYRYTNGKRIPCLKSLSQICTALDITPDYLFKDRYSNEAAVM